MGTGVCWGLGWAERGWVCIARCTSSSWGQPRGWEPQIPLAPAMALSEGAAKGREPRRPR